MELSTAMKLFNTSKQWKVDLAVVQLSFLDWFDVDRLSVFIIVGFLTESGCTQVTGGIIHQVWKQNR